MIAESQAHAFAAIDQSILSRRVGLPNEKIQPIPLDLTQKLEATVTDEAEASKQQHEHGNAAEAEALPDTAEDASDHMSEEVTVSVSHVLTNVIIFQSFLLELASLWQTRAGLFDEVCYV